MRGCTEPAKAKWWTNIDGEREDRCPRIFIKDSPEEFESIMLAYHSYKAGYLPCRGAMMDQNCMFGTLMFIVDSAVRHADNLNRDSSAESHTVVYNNGGSPASR